MLISVQQFKLIYLPSFSIAICVLVGMEYSPPLPVIKRHVWQRMPGGDTTKVVVTYKEVIKHQLLCKM